METEMIIDKEGVKKLIPHREPFLFVDGVIEIEPAVKIVAVKTFGAEEEFFRGHFPNNPIVPGVILIEAIAQAGGILVYCSYSEKLEGREPALVGLENVKFRRPVRPEDEVKLHVHVLKERPRMWKMKGEAFVNGMKVAEAEILASVF